MKNLAAAILILVFGSLALSQDVSDEDIQDKDRRGFDDRTPIYIDLDRDGKPDRIQPRPYQTRTAAYARRPTKRHIRNWITFDLTRSRGQKVRSFFTYNNGTTEPGGGYWVYALVPNGDVNKDGRVDLIFYAGDDTGHVIISLVSRGNRYVVRSRKEGLAGEL